LSLANLATAGEVAQAILPAASALLPTLLDRAEFGSRRLPAQQAEASTTTLDGRNLFTEFSERL
jgi:hypothetical protein